MKCKKIFVSEVGFEPTPSFEDQNAHSIEAKRITLESGALDRSAILTFLLLKKGNILFICRIFTKLLGITSFYF